MRFRQIGANEDDNTFEFLKWNSYAGEEDWHDKGVGSGRDGWGYFINTNKTNFRLELLIEDSRKVYF